MISSGISKRLLPLLFVALTLNIYGQKPTQTIRGTVIDAQTHETLPGANIILVGKNRGTTTNIHGNFQMENIEVGRYRLKVSYVGYEPVVIPELLLGSGKEKVLEIELQPAYSDLQEVVVEADIRKDRPQNAMATVSARTFSVEEASRYAGAIDDPGRMAGNFAGVSTVAPHINAIVVRGNAPKGLLWRLEGVDIPVPSHFSGSNVAGGGGLTMFSSQMLANSDFYTGAFPAEFGNATAGVFDMKLRNGNDQEHEYSFQIGVQGVEAAAEGPFRNKGNGSYLMNYRYSSMALIFPLLPEVNYTDELPVYQDLSFKLNLPAGKAGKFSVWGIGGLSHSAMNGTDNTNEWNYPENRETMDFHYNMGATGINHFKRLTDKAYIRSTLSLSANEHIYKEKARLDPTIPDKLFRLHDSKMTSIQEALSTSIHWAPGNKFSIVSGIDFSRRSFTLNGNARNYSTGDYEQRLDGNGNTWLSESFIQAKYDISKSFYITGGINASWFELNESYSFEPRLSTSWDVNSKHQLSLGYGNHSQTEPLFVYFVTNSSGQFPNKDLTRMRAHHLVFSWDWAITRNLRLKLEPYYQDLYNVPVVDGSVYSMLNFMSDWTFNQALVNKGTGTNKGIDLTLERFLKKGFYFMTTASVYDSKYTGGDNVQRRTRYDGGFVVNLLGGKEWMVRNKNLLSVNLKFTFMGPYWYHPVDKSATHLTKQIVYAQNKPFTYRYADLESMTDVTVNYRINGQNVSSVFSIRVKNIVGKQYMGKKYNLAENQIENDFFTSPVPFISYKIEF